MKRIFIAFFLFFSVMLDAENVSWLRYPSISPDGNAVAFSFGGDIYVVDSKGG